ncbi:MAG: Pycsar system effector family protein [bacterium]
MRRILIDNEKIDMQICKEDALNILDRIIGFINNCDNKTSIILGIVGVMLSIIFTSNSVNELQSIIRIAIRSSNYIYLILLVLFIICLVCGIFYLVFSLFARTNCSSLNQKCLDLNSKLFFHHISNNNSFKEYKEKVLKCSKDEFINEIISQIYINSKICSKKYNYYNRGLILISVSFIGFALVWLIGTIIY